MIVYSPHITPRLLYIADWLGNYLFDKPLCVTTDKKDLGTHALLINYSDEDLTVSSYQIKPSGLLFQNEVKPISIDVSQGEKLPFFFANDGQHPFDLLAAVFYLITRYEEYLPHEKDMYGRYAHENSLAFKYRFLSRPLVDEWMIDLKEKLQALFPSTRFAARSFCFTPTYDVDMAWSYSNKGFLRNTAGFLQNILQREWPLLIERIQTLRGKRPDPFAVFDDLDELHKRHRLTPVIFFLLAQKIIGYDKNISSANKAFQSLIKQLSKQYKTGIHLSWQASTNPSLMQSEKQLFETLTGKQTFANRMHYINFHLPQTFQQLQAMNIKEEYSMGYGSINGFRASTCTPYQWYDLQKETATSLRIFPYCYMEANSIFEQKDDPETALNELQHYHDIVKKANGVLVTIFHNHLIGRNGQGRVWWNMYEQFLQNNF